MIIRNIRINGISGSGNGGLNGIRFLAGADLNVENCVIFGFTQNGIDIALNQNTFATAHIINTVVKNVGGVGIRAANAQGPQPNGGVQVGITNSKIMIATTGIEAAQHSRVDVNSTVVQHASGDGMLADDPGTSDAQMAVGYSESSYNTNGITAGNGSSVAVGNSKVAFNTTCSLNQSGSGALSSYTNGTSNLTNQNVGAPCGTIGDAAAQ